MAKILLFVLAACMVYIAGFLITQSAWRELHPRGHPLESGHRHGVVNANLLLLDRAVFIKGESAPRWYWKTPTNFFYTHLEVKIHPEGKDFASVVEVPSLRYSAEGTNGILTVEFLGQLLGKRDLDTNEFSEVVTFIDHLRSAGEGRLPGPRHHYHRLGRDSGTLAHFSLGWSIGWVVYVWSAVWIYLLVQAARRTFEFSKVSKVSTKATPS